MNKNNGGNTIQRFSLLTGLISMLCLAFPQFTSAAQEVPHGREVVIVGGDQSYPPYEFIDKDGTPTGYNVELTRAIARVMGLNVEIRLGAWAEMRTALQGGGIDALQGMSHSPERALTIAFSPPHTIVHHSFFARKGAPLPTLGSLRNQEVIVLNHGIMEEFLRNRTTGARIVTAETHADALRLLASGKHDYVLMAKLPGLYLIRELGLSNLEAVGDPVSAQDYCFAVNKGNTALLARFSEGLAILKNSGEYQQIYNKWLGVLEPRGITWLQAAKYGAIVIVPLILLLGGMALWSRTLHREVALRTAELSREVAERRHAEEELRSQQQQLVQADKMAALGVLVSGVAHEINNPNGLILLNMPVVMEAFQDAQPILDEHYRQHGDFDCAGLRYSRMREALPRLMNQMLEGSRRVKGIVEDLKDFARQPAPEQTGDVDLNETVRTALRLLSNLIEKSTEHFSVEYGEGLPLVRGSSQRIEQVVVNLVMNACQALPSQDRGVALHTFYDAKEKRVALEVRDEGVGIPAENLSRLTDPFFTTKRETGGTGLGLSISTGIVKEHNGTLELESTPGKGTIARLSLPVPIKEL